MQEIDVRHFVRHIKRVVEEQNGRYAFFLGAGCSISSKIPGAARLVEHWLPKLKLDKTGTVDGLGDWVKTQFPGYGNDKAALFYADVMRALFPHPLQRQSEIERIVEGKDPAFGYAVLARLMTADLFGLRCNVVLTSNFDDLVADALYLYTRKKPLVIAHESLAGFARQSERPLVVKLHGDALLKPRNVGDEVAELPPEVTDMLVGLLHDAGLIFMGYGGNDKGILAALQGLPNEALDWGLYWVNDTVPDNAFGKWLRDRNATWVKHLDFDELMVLVRSEFALDHPDEKRFTVLMGTYRETFQKLSREVAEKPESADKAALETAVAKATKELPDWWSVAIEAYRYSTKDPELADRIYREGIKRFPNDADLLDSYAVFLTGVRKDHDKAEDYYRKALEADPEHTTSLGNYALFLWRVRKDHDKVENYFRKALEGDPENAALLGNYAVFLWKVRKNHDEAENHYRKALEGDPENAALLGNYALFLEDIRKDHGEAENHYRKALEADPEHAGHLGNYAVFLWKVRKDHDGAENHYRKALEADPEHANNLGNYALFLSKIRKDYDEAEGYYRKALEADPENATNLGNYAVFLTGVRKDLDEAENYYRKALEADPEHANNLGNYAGFHLALGRRDAGWPYLKKARDLADREDLKLELLFYEYAHTEDAGERVKRLTGIKKMIVSGVRSPGWDLTQNVERAVTDGHPEPKLLAKLAKVIAEEDKAEALEAFKAWKKA